ncbi:hypothetical protein ACU686_26035 [Yinghuangia aomiensis]
MAAYDAAGTVELAAGLALFMGFSKIAVSLGTIPEGLPTRIPCRRRGARGGCAPPRLPLSARRGVGAFSMIRVAFSGMTASI